MVEREELLGRIDRYENEIFDMRREMSQLRTSREHLRAENTSLELELKSKKSEVLELKQFIEDNINRSIIEPKPSKLSKDHEEMIELLKKEINNLENENRDYFALQKKYNLLEIEFKKTKGRVEELERDRSLLVDNATGLSGEALIETQKYGFMKIKSELNNSRAKTSEYKLKAEKLESKVRELRLQIRKMSSENSNNNAGQQGGRGVLGEYKNDIKLESSVKALLIGNEEPPGGSKQGGGAGKRSSGFTQNELKLKTLNMRQRKQIGEMNKKIDKMKKLMLKKNQEIRILCSIMFEQTTASQPKNKGVK